MYYPTMSRSYLITQSGLVIFVLIVLVVGMVVSVYIMRAMLMEEIGPTASIVASVCNAVNIQIFNLLYSCVAVALNNRENHRYTGIYQVRLVKTMQYTLVVLVGSWYLCCLNMIVFDDVS